MAGKPVLLNRLRIMVQQAPLRVLVAAAVVVTTLAFSLKEHPKPAPGDDGGDAPPCDVLTNPAWAPSAPGTAAQGSTRLDARSSTRLDARRGVSRESRAPSLGNSTPRPAGASRRCANSPWPAAASRRCQRPSARARPS